MNHDRLSVPFLEVGGNRVRVLGRLGAVIGLELRQDCIQLFNCLDKLIAVFVMSEEQAVVLDGRVVGALRLDLQEQGGLHRN